MTFILKLKKLSSRGLENHHFDDRSEYKLRSEDMVIPKRQPLILAKISMSSDRSYNVALYAPLKSILALWSDEYVKGRNSGYSEEAS